MYLKKNVFNGAVLASILATSAVISHPVSAQLTVAIEAPGQEQSALYLSPSTYGATNVYQADFNSISAGYHTGPITLANIGTINSGFIQTANEYGGAGGTGNYFDVDKDTSGVPTDTSSTLTLNSPESYFGMWWSAGDSYNSLTFYGLVNGVETPIETFSTANVISYLQNTANTSAYYGNPSGQFQGQDSGEPFAYLNFYAPQGLTFNEIVFSDPGNTGFESDNWTVASSYTSIAGTVLTPEPSNTVGLLVIAGLGLISQIKRVFPVKPR